MYLTSINIYQKTVHTHILLLAPVAEMLNKVHILRIHFDFAQQSVKRFIAMPCDTKICTRNENNEKKIIILINRPNRYLYDVIIRT